MPQVDDTLRAIAEPRRLAILRLVASEELSAGHIAEHFEGVTRSAVSQHLQVLKDAELISERREGTKRLYRASEDGLAELRRFLDQMWGDSVNLARRLAEGGDGEEEIRAVG
ncbi:DNA-binding transcriptional ArsR family regulator [Nonomuraea polychroma]|uniref:DNA-binding transcriptional ArsR family regulator n=1 Tax=Nonomuraea polychroma TaxID=46176 RepID=A0A438M1T1_9ACTN|nr:DNA-binding transcriptional ArsR family regulator [Nonomuraea polychroma]